MRHKVIWSEGMFLQPQHFQQHERYLEKVILRQATREASHQWGIAELKVDQHLLNLGKFSIQVCRGILPDGTLVDIPNQDEEPTPIDIEEGIVDTPLYLAIPLSRAGAPEAAYDSQQYRYRIETIEVSDNNQGYQSIVPIQVGKLCFRLLLEHEDRQGYSCMPIARIQEIKAGHQIVLDDEFIPPCLDSHAVTSLASLQQEIQGLLNYRGTMLVERLASAATGAAEIADFLLLQIINRYEPLLHHISKQRGQHPEQLFRLLLQLASELATFTSSGRRYAGLPAYQHERLEACFNPLAQELRRALSIVLEESALAIPLEERQASTWVAALRDKQLLHKAIFILAVYANLPADDLRQQFPNQIKVAPVEEIRNLVNRALPGIDLQLLQIAPRQIPFHANYTYFALNREQPLWQMLNQSAGIAFHVGGQFPGLRLELWAVKG